MHSCGSQTLAHSFPDVSIWFKKKPWCLATLQKLNTETLVGHAKGLGSIDAVFGLIFKMADVKRFDSTRFVNYKKMVFLIRCMAGYHGNAHISKIIVLKR